MCLNCGPLAKQPRLLPRVIRVCHGCQRVAQWQLMVGGMFHHITCSSLASTAAAREKHNEDLTGGILYNVPVPSSFASPLGA